MKIGWVEEHRLKKLAEEKKPFRWERHPAYREPSIEETAVAKAFKRYEEMAKKIDKGFIPEED